MCFYLNQFFPFTLTNAHDVSFQSRDTIGSEYVRFETEVVETHPESLIEHTSSTHTECQTELRKSARERRKPMYLQDYHHNLVLTLTDQSFFSEAVTFP